MKVPGPPRRCLGIGGGGAATPGGKMMNYWMIGLSIYLLCCLSLACLYRSAPWQVYSGQYG